MQLSCQLLCFIEAFPCKIRFRTFYYFSKPLSIWGYLIFCSNGSHFGHRVNYHVSKVSAEHI